MSTPMMNKQSTTVFRKKPEFKIFNVNKTPKKSFSTLNSRTGDLEQAINSISYTPDQSDYKVTQKLTLASNGSPNEKIVFSPRTPLKKFQVVRDIGKKGEEILAATPSSSKIIMKPSPNFQSLKAITPILGGPPKKRKLGDYALQSFQSKNLMKIKPEPLAHSSVCCICGSDIEGTPVPLKEDDGSLTETGRKVQTIRAEEKMYESRSSSSFCCVGCSVKVKVCFALMLEVQASGEAMNATYEDVDEGETVRPNNHVYVCKYCETEVLGFKDYTKHVENHLMEKALGITPSMEDPIKSTAHENDEEGQNITWNGRLFVEDDVEEDGTTHQPNEDGEHLCEVCNRGFKYMFLLRLHRKTPKRVPVAQPVQMKMCISCQKQKPNLITWDEVCESCLEKTGPSIPEEPIKKPEKTHQKRFFCDTCGAGFEFKYALRHHFKFHEKMESKFYINRCCHICMEDMKSTHSLRNHLLVEHNITWKEGSNNYTCQKCFKPFDDLFQLRMHLRLYHDVALPTGLRSPRLRTFACHVCQENFNSENSARKHMRKQHNLANNQMESLKTACEECGKVFSVKQNLKNHINAMHLKIKPMSCDVCGERFVKHSSLIFHKLRHTGEKPFQCALCEKTYRQRNDVIRHLARHVRDKDCLYDDAYAVNTSSSKYIFKRLVYLKDSTIKGLQDIAKCDGSAKKRKRAKVKGEEETEIDPITLDVQTEQQEIVISDGSVLVERNFEATDEQFIYTAEEENTYVVRPVSEVTEESINKYKVLVNEIGEQSLQSPNGGYYVLKENEDGEQYLIKIDSIE